MSAHRSVFLAFACLVLLTVPLASPGVAVVPDPIAPGAAPPCEVPPFIGNTQLVTMGPGEHLVVHFTAPHAMTGDVYASTALHWATTAQPPTNHGFAAERAMATTWVEEADGTLLEGGLTAFLAYPYGIQVDTPLTSVRVAAQDQGGCGAVAAPTPVTLEPGHTYRAVTLAHSETGNGGGVFLPPEVTITAVSRGPLVGIEEGAMDCLVNYRVAAAGFSSQALFGCATPYEARGAAYRTTFMGRFPDSFHQVAWRDPDGASVPVAFFQAARGAPGTWTLEVPQYGTLLGQPFFLPGAPQQFGSDSGVFGAFADVAN